MITWNPGHDMLMILSQPLILRKHKQHLQNLTTFTTQFNSPRNLSKKASIKFLNVQLTHSNINKHTTIYIKPRNLDIYIHWLVTLIKKFDNWNLTSNSEQSFYSMIKYNTAGRRVKTNKNNVPWHQPSTEQYETWKLE